MTRTRIYVDGFNLYYGALKGTRYKWLDPVRLSVRLLPGECAIEKVLFFTARVSGISDPGASGRQQVYLNALHTRPEVEVHFGNFIAKTAWRPLANLPVANRRIGTPKPLTLFEGNYLVTGGKGRATLPIGSYPEHGTKRKKRKKTPAPLSDALIAEFHTMEEKGSDVNLACHLLNDAWKGLFDVAVVISNDTDLVTPIRMVVAEQGKPVYIVCPGRWQVAPKLREAATFVRHIREPILKTSQFPDQLPGTKIVKPAGW